MRYVQVSTRVCGVVGVYGMEVDVEWSGCVKCGGWVECGGCVEWRWVCGVEVCVCSVGMCVCVWCCSTHLTNTLLRLVLSMSIW